MTFHVYVLINPTGETYVGQTSNLQRRLEQHNDPDFIGTVHTKRHKGPWQILHTETFGSRSHAIMREKELKTGKGRDFIRSLPALGCCQVRQTED